MAAAERDGAATGEPERPIEAMSFEEAMAELEALVQKLERGQLDLEASIAAYERGTALRRHCAKKLEEAELRVEKLGFDREGRPTLEPFAERS
jgi:exodeoxyribonuclease VII small subunit